MLTGAAAGKVSGQAPVTVFYKQMRAKMPETESRSFLNKQALLENLR